MAAAVECENAALPRLEKNSIRVLSGRYGREDLVACPIENENGPCSTVRDITNLACVIEGDAMRVGQTGNLGDQFAG